jgi:hypothetical protein
VSDWMERSGLAATCTSSSCSNTHKQQLQGAVSLAGTRTSSSCSTGSCCSCLDTAAAALVVYAASSSSSSRTRGGLGQLQLRMRQPLHEMLVSNQQLASQRQCQLGYIMSF